MSSLYADYLAECGQSHIIENESGFVTYRIMPPECYIVDIYVKPEARKSHLAAQMADQVAKIAKTENCTILTGSVNMSIKDPTRSAKVLLAYGFKILKCDPSIIWFGKEL